MKNIRKTGWFIPVSLIFFALLFMVTLTIFSDILSAPASAAGTTYSASNSDAIDLRVGGITLRGLTISSSASHAGYLLMLAPENYPGTLGIRNISVTNCTYPANAVVYYEPKTQYSPTLVDLGTIIVDGFPYALQVSATGKAGYFCRTLSEANSTATAYYSTSSVLSNYIINAAEKTIVPTDVFLSLYDGSSYSLQGSIINNAYPDFTIIIPAGDYTAEGALTVNKNLKLIAQTYAVTTANDSEKSILHSIAITADSTNIEGFKFTGAGASTQSFKLMAGGGALITLSGVTNAIIKSNEIAGNGTPIGIAALSSGTLDISANIFTNLSTAIAAEAASIAVSSNSITGVDTVVSGTVSNSITFFGNTATDIAAAVFNVLGANNTPVAVSMENNDLTLDETASLIAQSAEGSVTIVNLGGNTGNVNLGGNNETGGQVIIPVTLPFTDVQAGTWYYSAVDFVTDYGLFNGVTANAFKPDSGMTRAMFVTVLGRLAEKLGFDISGYSLRFEDTETGSWYAKYVAWAHQAGIVEGYPDGSFRPDKLITREQMAVIFIRFANFMDITLKTNGSTSFKDMDDVSLWAVEDVLKAAKAGLISGFDDGNYYPLRNLTRAQAATVFMNFVKAYID